MKKETVIEIVKPRTRLYLPEAGEALITRSDPEIRTICRVLRLKPGENAACFNGDGIEHLYRIECAGQEGLILALQASRPNPRDPKLKTSVWIASSKGKTKEEAVRSLTPLGVTQITFFHAERSVSRPESRATERLGKIAMEACRQCGRSTIPVIEVCDTPLSETFDSRSSVSCGILFWEGSPHASMPVSEIASSPVDVVFGPEGGFTKDEVDWLREHGFFVAGLGPRILRTDLAVIVGVTLVQYQRGLLSKHGDS